jgi:hypothetical protein
VEDWNSEETLVGRRRALGVFGLGLGAGGLVLLAGPAAAAGASCQDVASIDETGIGLRRALQYKEKSATPGKQCAVCVQFEPGKYGACGGCKVLMGGVSPEGSCLSFAPKEPSAPAAPAPVAPPAPPPAKKKA